MPEGYLGIPRISNIGPISRSTKQELKKYWENCPQSKKRNEICESIKYYSLKALEQQGIFPDCENLMDINSGKCSWIAKNVYNELDYVNALQIMNGDHVWIEHDGIHYDAEIPTGMRDPFDLPIFYRIPPDEMLYTNQLWADIEDRKRPETVEELIIEVDEFQPPI